MAKCDEMVAMIASTSIHDYWQNGWYCNSNDKKWQNTEDEKKSEQQQQ